MKFIPTPLPGVFEIETQPIEDARGSFARIFCQDSFATHGIAFQPVQTSLSVNTQALTLRGLHFQSFPNAEQKLVRCIHGRVWDVVVDLRPGPNFGEWYAVELSADRMNAIYIPEGLAHGFLTLTPGAVVHYQISPSHVPGYGQGVRWDDPTLAIAWPAMPSVISLADQFLPPLMEIANAPKL